MKISESAIIVIFGASGDLTFRKLIPALFALNGDATLYARADTVEAAWNFIQPIQQAWETDPEIPIFGYLSGTWGSEGADDLIETPELTWRYPCKNLSDDREYCEL